MPTSELINGNLYTEIESGVKTSNNLHTKFNPRDTPDYQLVLIAKNY